METLNNAASAASRAIWGDSTTANTNTTSEPVSGQTGNTAIGEPYDAGNLDPTDTGTSTPRPHESNIGNKVDPTVDSTSSSTGDYNTKLASQIDPHSSNTTSTPTNAGLHDSNFATKAGPTDSDRDGFRTARNTSNIPDNTTKTGLIRPEHDTNKTGVTSVNHTSNTFSDNRPTNRNDNSGTGTSPSVGAAPESGAEPTVKQQGADKPMSGPKGADEHAAVKDSKGVAEQSQSSGLKGAGPKVPSSGGDVAKKDDGPQKQSHGQGTGEKYVKSSGLKADGGDFDAANPGAGKEADRLLEQKGVKREAPAAGSGGTDKDDTEAKHDLSDSGKPSFKDKIKAKLHKN